MSSGRILKHMSKNHKETTNTLPIYSGDLKLSSQESLDESERKMLLFPASHFEGYVDDKGIVHHGNTRDAIVANNLSNSTVRIVIYKNTNGLCSKENLRDDIIGREPMHVMELGVSQYAALRTCSEVTLRVETARDALTSPESKSSCTFGSQAATAQNETGVFEVSVGRLGNILLDKQEGEVAKEGRIVVVKKDNVGKVKVTLTMFGKVLTLDDAIMDEESTELIFECRAGYIAAIEEFYDPKEEAIISDPVLFTTKDALLVTQETSSDGERFPKLIVRSKLAFQLRQGGK